jgi:hypothetical protein
MSKIIRYKYSAIIKRVKKLSIKAGLKKPMDFYNFRHSSCYLDKIDNVPLDLASERHGHSVEFYTKIYGRLDSTDKANRLSKHYGGEDEEKKRLEKNIVCDRCDFINDPGTDFCGKCSSPLNLKAALNVDAILKKQMADLIAKVETLSDIKAELAKRK